MKSAEILNVILLNGKFSQPKIFSDAFLQ